MTFSLIQRNFDYHIYEHVIFILKSWKHIDQIKITKYSENNFVLTIYFSTRNFKYFVKVICHMYISGHNLWHRLLFLCCKTEWQDDDISWHQSPSFWLGLHINVISFYENMYFNIKSKVLFKVTFFLFDLKYSKYLYNLIIKIIIKNV